MKSPEADSYIQARHFRWANRKAAHWLVVHCALTSELPTAAEALGRYAHNPPSTRGPFSYHYAVDNDSIVQCVDERHIAHCAPGSNGWGIQVEFSGMHTQTRAEWLDEYSRPMLDRGAVLVGAAALRWGIPLRFVDCEGLLMWERGVTTHAEVTKACRLAKARKLTATPFYKARTTHIDPGKHFPMDYLIEKACDSVGTIPALSEVEHA